eukprot:75791_1
MTSPHMSSSNEWIPGECGLFLKTNLTIPHISSVDFEHTLDFKQSYDVLFHSKNYYTTQIDSIEKMYNYTEFALYAMNIGYRNEYNIKNVSFPRLSLPTLHTTSLIEDIIFSDQYGLLVIGDTPFTSIHTLSFKKNINNFFEWKWKKFCPVGFAETLSKDASCLLFGSSTGNEKLFICGQLRRNYRNMQSFILDLETKKWSNLPNLPHHMKRPGVCYHCLNNTVYVAGTGYSYNFTNRPHLELSSVMYCDLYKPNKWYKLPEPLSKQMDNNVIWIDENILYVASTSMNRIECIDLRNSKKQTNWKRIVKSMDKHEPLYLSKMFDGAINATQSNNYKLFR